MANLEYVIRPYQSPNPFGTILIPSTPTQADRATLTWGATAQGTMPPAQAKPTPMTYQFQCCQEKLNEQSRVNDSVRITGNDGESYVDVDRPRVVKLQKNTAQSCASPLEQISDVFQGINQVLDEFANDIKYGDTTRIPDECHTEWDLSP
jgi:hypothetical protein